MRGESGGFESLDGEGEEMRQPVCAHCGERIGQQHSEECELDGEVRVGDLIGMDAAAVFGEDYASRTLPETVHIAGPDMSVDGVMRQRCAWCGALLLEYNLANIMVQVEPGETAMAPAMFAPGVHVRVAGVWPVMHVAVEPEVHPPDAEHPGAFVIPENSCMGLDIDVTR